MTRGSVLPSGEILAKASRRSQQSMCSHFAFAFGAAVEAIALRMKLFLHRICAASQSIERE
jgi:hypothetical protein